MAHTSIYLANKILLSDFNAIPHTRATTGEIRLYKNSDPPAKDGTGGTLLGAGHVAEPISFNGATWTVSGMTATNAGVMTGNANGTAEVIATHYGIFDSSGNLMFVGPLTANITVTSGAPYQIPAGAIDFTIGGAFTNDHGNDWLDYILTGAAFTQVSGNLKIQLVSTAPTASAAGTGLAGTGYLDLTIAASSTFWTVADNVVTNAEEMEYGQAGSDWTDPFGHNVIQAATLKRLYFMAYGSAQAVILNNLPIWRQGALSFTIV